MYSLLNKSHNHKVHLTQERSQSQSTAYSIKAIKHKVQPTQERTQRNAFPGT